MNNVCLYLDYKYFLKGANIIYTKMKLEHQRISNQIKEIQNQLSTLPPGKLICCNDKTKCKWYISDSHHKFYLSKSNRSTAEQLAIKKYLLLLLEDLENEKKAIEFYLRHHSPSGKSEQLLTNPSEYQNLLKPYFSPLQEELSNWMNLPYEKKTNHAENLIHRSSSGNIVRSKSEMMIDMFLHVHNIPFRYECALHLENATIYPDFTIRHPKSGDFYYWEHFGLMDNPSYAQNVPNKLRTYISNGIIPSINLITTYETQSNPLSTEAIENLVKYYFL